MTSRITAAEPVTYRRERLVSVITTSEDQFRLLNERTGKVLVVDRFGYAVWALVPLEGSVAGSAVRAQIEAMTEEKVDPEEFAAAVERLRSGGFIEEGSARKGYDALAEGYDARPPYDPFVFDFIREHTTAHHRSRVLEVGCGTGAALGGLAGLAPASLCGLDVSRGMLEQAQRRIEREKISATLVHAMAESMPFNDGAFTSMVLAHALHWLDPAPFWAEASRVLDPDNRAFVVLRLPDPTCENAFTAALTWGYGPYWKRMPWTVAQNLPHHVDILHIEHRPDEMVIDSADAFVRILLTWAPLGGGRRWPPRNEMLRDNPTFPLRVPCVTTLAVLRLLRPSGEMRFPPGGR